MRGAVKSHYYCTREKANAHQLVKPAFLSHTLIDSLAVMEFLHSQQLVRISPLIRCTAMRKRRQEITAAAAFVSATLLCLEMNEWMHSRVKRKRRSIAAYNFILISSVRHHNQKFSEQTCSWTLFLNMQPDELICKDYEIKHYLKIWFSCL